MNPGEKTNQEASHNEWADAMADVEPWQRTKSEQEKSEGELIASIKRGYFEKSPEDIHTETAQTLNRMKEKLVKWRDEGDKALSLYDERVVAEIEQATSKYGPDIEANGVSVVDLMQLATGLSDTPLERKYLFEDTRSHDGKGEAIKILEDSHERYFSEQAPHNQGQTMSSILKKIRFKRDLKQEIGSERRLLSDIYSQPEEYGLPPEIQDYTFSLSDQELSLLANAEDDDMLANRLKKFLPLPIQQEIVARMPDSKYKNAVLGSLLLGDIRSDQCISKGYTNFRTFGPDETVEYAKDLKKKIEWITPIVHQLDDRKSIELLVSNNGIEIISNPYEQYYNGGDTARFIEFTGMGWADFATQQQREQRQEQQEIKDMRSQAALNAARKEQAVREGNFW